MRDGQIGPVQYSVGFSMNRLRTFHLIVGVSGLIAFLLSGQYMHHFLGHLKDMSDGPRLLYRSAHIYLLFASLLNLLLSSYLIPVSRGRARYFQVAASLMLMLAPAFIGFSFFSESNVQELFRPVVRIGIYIAAAGCIMHAFVSSIVRRKNGQSDSLLHSNAKGH